MSAPRSTDETPTLAQIVAALSVTYRDGGVIMWLCTKPTVGLSPIEMIERGMHAGVADKVRGIGDADPSDFSVTEERRRWNDAGWPHGGVTEREIAPGAGCTCCWSE